MEGSPAIVTLGERVRDAVAALFSTVLDHESYLWWPFLLSMLVIALIGHVVTLRQGERPLTSFVRRYLGAAIWWHRSARADYRYYLVNGVLYRVLVAPLILSSFAVAAFVEHALSAAFGRPIASNTEIWPVLFFTIAFFVAYDLGRFIAHSLLHDVPTLWEFHKTHHSAEVLTPMTSFRLHPVDLFLMAVVPNLLTGVTAGCVFWAFGREVPMVTFLGVHFLLFLCNLLGNLRHWHVWISYGRHLGHVFISPAHHQIHHSADPRHWGRNRGFELAIWDWLYGTLHVPTRREELRFGLGDGSDGTWHGVGSLYLAPLNKMLVTLKNWKLPRVLKDYAADRK
jgi:sterol desaturase/sphingolipid hydroxylase (fatty acid hydroxylase superfamily)